MHALPPGSTIGILGGGQLGRMLAIAAAQLGLKCHIYNDVEGPACEVAGATTIAPFDDMTKIEAFAHSVDVVTYEFENVPPAAADGARRIKTLRPGLKSLEMSQDRLVEKQFVSDLGLPVAPFANIESTSDLDAALRDVGTPSILKTRRLGYDGKGQVRISKPEELAQAFDDIGRAPATLEAMVAFEHEISVVLVRSATGEIRCYDIPVNRHEGGILRTSTVPCHLDPPHQSRACEIATEIANALDHVGVIAVEMFFVGGPEPLVVNEFAPRVHNSGHWTIDACPHSQFENHIRAVAGWPLGPTDRHSDARMDNLIGDDVDAWERFAGEPEACLHLYGKAEARPGRKMGHVTWLSPRSSGP